MKRPAWMLTALVLAAGNAGADCKEEAACAEIKAKIRNIEAKKRAGYTRAQGERYNRQLKVLKAKRSKLCR